MAELKALIFDIDGTLAETERDAHLPAFNDAFVAHGLDWHWSDSLYGDLLRVTGGKERMHYYINDFNASRPQVDDLNAFIAQLHKAKTANYVERVSTGKLALRPGIRRIMEEARREGILLAIATTTSIENVEVLLKHSLAADTMAWFAAIGAGDVVEAKKPAPDIYTYVLEKLNLPAENCVVFEDSYNGLCAARGANLTTLITPSEYTRHENFDGAALVVDCLGDPDQPCKVLSGEKRGDYVDIAWLRALLAGN